MFTIDFCHRGLARSTSLAGALLGAAAAGALVAATHLGAASAAVEALSAAVTCAAATACVSGGNSKAGPGVSGTSAAGTGVVGVTTGSSSTAFGVLGTSAETVGVSGRATDNANAYNEGVFGSSYNGYGVVGRNTGSRTPAVAGNGGEVGVYGYSPTGIGVLAAGPDSPDANASALVNNSGAGSAIHAIAKTGTAVLASTWGGVALRGTATGSASYPLALVNSDTGHIVFLVDQHGDVMYAGGIHRIGATAAGRTMRSFGSETTAPTVEDTGTASLVGGTAVVPLDRTFASAIDPHVAYRLFLAPNGETHGLYVASKTPAGFVVREVHGGHANLNFDYRIVATALGQAGQHMEVVDRATLPRVQRPAVTLPEKTKLTASP